MSKLFDKWIYIKKIVFVYIYIYLNYGFLNIEILNLWLNIELFDILKGFRVLLIKFEI